MIASDKELIQRELSLIDNYLSQQSRLTPVSRFAQFHERDELPAQARYYHDLIPLTMPTEGQQYAFEVELDACSGCKSCVAACHSLNGLDEGETWRDVGLLLASAPAEGRDALTQHVSSACHHCLEPACMHGCPVNAYEKDAVTGIVRHLDDQCIGCQYCILKCPYDVPKYSRSRGIVRKCDMCSDRLEAAEAPACVQACPTQAIRISLVDRQQVRAEARARHFLPGAPEPDYTLPATQFKTRRDLSRARPGDEFQVRPEHAHWSLILMLVLTQLSVGGFVVARTLDAVIDASLSDALTRVHATLSIGLGMLALGASTLHLGRPRLAYRAVIGLRRSWLSREIVTFGLFAGLAMAYAAGLWLAPTVMTDAVRGVLGTAVVVTGLGGVFCSAMIYHDTRRVLWRIDRTLIRFLGTALMLGTPSLLLAAVLASSAGLIPALSEVIDEWGQSLCLVLVCVTLAKLLFEAAVLRYLWANTLTPMKRTAILLAGSLHQVTMVRFAVGFVGGAGIPLLLAGVDPAQMTRPALLIALALIVLLTLTGELCERYLFFTSVIRPKMPGGVGA